MIQVLKDTLKELEELCEVFKIMGAYLPEEMDAALISLRRAIANLEALQ
jgi:hypothetical protein